MLHIDTRELHPGLIMPACRSSRVGERGKCGKRREERRRRRGRRRRRWRRRSGRGEARGREEQQEVQPRVPGGAQIFIPVDLSSSVPPVPRCPSSWSPMCPLHLRFLRRRSAPSAIRCCGALHLRYACSCCSDALTVASQPSPFSPTWRAEIMTGSTRNESLWFAHDAIYILKISTSESLTIGELWCASIVEAQAN